MAIGHLVQQLAPQSAELQSLLEQEMRTPQALEPVIIEDTSRFQGSKRLYIIWSRWGALSQQERSRIIMGAYETTHNKLEVGNVTVAMGLTPDEAANLGIRYVTDSEGE